MIRTIRPQEIEQSLKLTQVAFGVQFSDEQEKERRDQMNTNEYLGFFVDGSLASQLAILPLRIYLQGAVLEMGGIAHVASYPELRKQGMAGKLLASSLEKMKTNGQSVSMLNPFSYAFYRKYGWEYFAVEKTYTFDMSVIPKHMSPEGGSVKRMKASDWRTAKIIYDAYALRYNGMLVRDERWWISQVFKRKPGYFTVYYNVKGAPMGYLLFDIKATFMNIHEIVYLDESARRGLWQFVGNHSPIVNRIGFHAPIDDPFLFTMSEPKLQQELSPKCMVRIVDVGAFIGQYRFAHERAPAKLTIRLKDEHAEWNRGLWDIVIHSDGSGSAARCEDDRKSVVSCDIQTFSTMMIGCQRPEQLALLGSLRGNAEEIGKWERAIPRRISYSSDLF
ncbi:GNAT family N-acetyltransferase [Paenibacillus sp. HB172176]|uniref:GNAT family N-acetyltransferase n=1 Tax=Paenibacillus sp. HB172176 TaxID=2493690 RepID=UPI00143C24A1|nr:GNAT family N-acetyltransferase [Paenibacillus sp. HB172176]